MRNFISECPVDIYDPNISKCIIYLGNRKNRFYYNGRSYCIKKISLLVYSVMTKNTIVVSGTSRTRSICGSDLCVNPLHIQLVESMIKKNKNDDKEKQMIGESDMKIKNQKKRKRLSEDEYNNIVKMVHDGNDDELEEYMKKNSISIRSVKNIMKKKSYLYFNED